MSSPQMALAPTSARIPFQQLANWAEARSGVLAFALCICFAVLSLALAAARPFWFDEIITISIARTHTFSDFVRGFLVGYDQTPPLNTLLVRVLCSRFGWTEMVARLPSVIFATAGLWILFRQIRRFTTGLFGLAAMSILLDTFLSRYACEARPYALLFFASALALSVWCSIPYSSSKASTRKSVLFGLAMLLTVLAHYYAVLVILPFAFDELRSRPLRKALSLRLACGITGLGLGLLVQLPLVHAASQRRLTHFWASPSFHNLRASYGEILVWLGFALVCVILVLSWSGVEQSRSIEPQSREERLGWFFLSIPIAGYVLAEVITHAFTPRYFVPVLAGLALGVGGYLYRHYRNTLQVPLLILLVTIPLFAQASFSSIRNARTHVISGRTEVADFVDEMLPRFHNDGKLFVLVPIGKSYLEARYYASDPTMLRGLHQPDLPVLPLAQDPLHIRYFSMDDIRQHARETAFIEPTSDLLSYLDRLGFHIHWRRTEPEAVVYVE